MESLFENFFRHVCVYSCVFRKLFSVILWQLLCLRETSICSPFCNCSERR